MSSLSDVFTADEIARASGVPREAVKALVAWGDLRPYPGTSFFGAQDALRAGREARRVASELADAQCKADPGLFAMTATVPAPLGRRRALPTFAASCVHATLVVLLIWLASRATETAAITPAPRPRLIFLALPGEGGGGGGGGLRNPLPPPRLASTTPRLAPSVPAVSPDRALLTARRVDIPVRQALPKPVPD